jgi:alanine transaminase
MAFNNMARRAMSTYSKVLTKTSINPNVLNAKYAVRGEIVLRSIEHAKALKSNHNLPFNSIVSCNIGNPQECGQKPLTFPRQVMSLLDYPELLKSPAVKDIFPTDVIERAGKYMDNISGGIGAYSHSKGVEVVRQEVASFLEKRDGFSADPEDIFLTDGASPGIQNTLNMIINGKQDGIMIPIPQYPLYSAAIALLGGTQVGYFLNEDGGTEIDRIELDRALKEAREVNNLNVKVMAVINPGNPSGQCLTYEDMEGILKFCHDEEIILLADEVYQENIWQSENPFYSFKKVLRTMEKEGKLPQGDVELFSYHSVSKGFLGECGRRGGYMEMVNIVSIIYIYIYLACCMITIINKSKLTIIIIKHIYIYIE